jgi:hypothetical protein
MRSKRSAFSFLAVVPLVGAICFAGMAFAQTDARLNRATRAEQNGWILVHLEGPPADLGYQHGSLLAPEIDDVLKTLAGLFRGSAGKDWDFLRDVAQRVFLPKLGEEYRTEIQGIVDGLRGRGYRYDLLDIVVLNAWMELAWYYLPELAEKEKVGSGINKTPGHCSAFIATGAMTKDGRIVMGHNNWVDYAVGSRWRMAWDIQPAKGYRMVMDGLPGMIMSGDDFALNGAGILITETTITGHRSFDWKGTPEFVRARRAAQYSESIDGFVRIMSEDSNGALANTWLVGDLKANEIAKLDLGLKHRRLWRTKDGAFTGANYATDEGLLKEETTFNSADPTTSEAARRVRWEQLMIECRGKIDAELGMKLLADHVDVLEGKTLLNRHGLCGHVDRDPVGCPAWGNPPFNPSGAVTAKVTTAELAKSFAFWGRAGHPCGEPFDAASFLEQHPQFRWQAAFLRDMKPQPWTLIRTSDKRR